MTREHLVRVGFSMVDKDIEKLIIAHLKHFGNRVWSTHTSGVSHGNFIASHFEQGLGNAGCFLRTDIP